MMKEKQATILFDGVCNLCNNSVNIIVKKDKKQLFRFVALQSVEGKKFVKKFQIPEKTDSVILIQNNKVFIESDATLEISKLLPFPWNAALIFQVIPKKWRNSFYCWIAKNRYRWFGKRNSCRII